MRAIAEYAMRGRTQAVTVAAISAAVPMMFWISAATIALITLRRGWIEGVSLLLWASLPAIVWLVMQQDPMPLLVILGTGILAVVLRATVSWVYAMLVGTALGILISWLMPLMFPELIAEAVRIAQQMLHEMASQVAVETGARIEDWFRTLFSGVLGAIHLLAMLGSLILARWWQSTLFNPGGFRSEFHQVILPRQVAIPMMLVMAFGTSIHPGLVGLLPAFSVPFVIAAMALVHGMVAISRLGTQWLVAFYLIMFFAVPYVYVLLMILGFVDSILDFRKRMQNRV